MLSASGTTDDEPPLTMGDLLASVAQSQQDQLDASTLRESDQRSLDAMVEFGSDELMRTAMKLQGELSAVERNTSALLSERLGDADARRCGRSTSLRPTCAARPRQSDFPSR